MADLLPAGSFRDSEFWEEFFKDRKGRAFEWYVDWQHLYPLLAQHCHLDPSTAPPPHILVPGCGNSELSAHIYDSGFHQITNIDFCHSVIREMLHKHARLRPHMLWRVMDMTKTQFSGSSFDLVLDKGGLDALLGEPEEDPTTGIKFLAEVQRILKPGGQYACVTLAQEHVIGILFSSFRCGWSLDVYQIPISSGTAASSLSPFLVVARRLCSSILPSITLYLDKGAYHPEIEQVRCLEKTIEDENKFRHEGKHERMGLCNHCKPLSESGLVSKFPDGVKKLQPGRRTSIVLSGTGQSQSSYRALMLDAPEGSAKPVYQCAVFLVPKSKAHEWLFSSEEGQWKVVETAKSGRLIMVFLEVNYLETASDIKDELSPLVKEFLPSGCEGHNSVPYLMSDDGILKRTLLEEINSSMTGSMFVEDVVLSKGGNSGIEPKEQTFRRLIFKRNLNLIQSEALLLFEKMIPKKHIRCKHNETSRHCMNSKKRLSEVEKDVKQGAVEGFKIDHSYLASPYHGGMVAGLSLIASSMERWLSLKEQIRVMVIGLGAGLLPMFIYKHLPVHNIQVVEIDPVVLDVAKRHFSFLEDERMQLQVGDGVAIVEALARLNCGNTCEKPSLDNQPLLGQPCKSSSPDVSGSNGTTTIIPSRVHILLIDADSSESSEGISCPPMEFLEQPFLQASRKALLEGGILAVNFVSRVTGCYENAVKNLAQVFQEVYDLKIEDDDVNRVLFALPQASALNEDLSEILVVAEKLHHICSKFTSWGHGPNLSQLLRTLKRLK